MDDIQSGGLIVTLKGKQAIAIKSIEQAVKVAAEFRDTADYGCMIGANEYYRVKAGRVYNGTTRIAQIHYNGRVEHFNVA